MAVSVNDNRMVEEGRPNNSMLISCDHASNELSGLYTTPVEAPYILSKLDFSQNFDILWSDVCKT